MDKKHFLARYYAILTASTIASSIAGTVFGVGVYQIIMDRNVPEGSLFPNLFQFLFAIFVGACAAVVAHVVIATKGARTYLAERCTRAIIRKLVFTPVLFVALSLV